MLKVQVKLKVKPKLTVKDQSNVGVPPPKTDFRYIDLFCGIGGFHLALNGLTDAAGRPGTCVFASDIDENCQNIYELNHGIRPVGDIRAHVETLPAHDLLCGGFPCQPFSNAGKKQARADQRGLLFDSIVRILERCRPKVVILENVKHIRKVSDGQVFAHILAELARVGYGVFVLEMSPMDIGIPQNRERVIFVILRNDVYSDAVRDRILAHVQTDVAAQLAYRTGGTWPGILETNPGVKYAISPEFVQLFTAWDEFIQLAGRFNDIISPVIIEYFTAAPDPAHKQWKNDYIAKNAAYYAKYRTELDPWLAKWGPLLTKKVIYGKLEWQVGGIRPGDSIWNYFIQMRQSGIRVKKNNCFPALVAIVQTSIVAKERRYLTPRECARLQSVPDTFQWNNQSDALTYKQLGNGVNADVIRVVCQAVLREITF